MGDATRQIACTRCNTMVMALIRKACYKDRHACGPIIFLLSTQPGHPDIEHPHYPLR
jgi:hypothetical protein